MWIKICGNTRLQDCLLAAELGANAVGFVFAPGKRTVTATQVAPIIAQLPGAVEKIGVFTTTDADEILLPAKAAGLTGVQLHSEFDPRLAGRMRSAFVGRLIQVVHWATDVPSAQQVDSFAAHCRAVAQAGFVDAVLVDSCTRTASGGTGLTFDWAAAAGALAGLPIPVIVAGGLRPENVGAAIAALQPWGVDVASGVESAPGIKAAARLRAFIENARKAKG